MAGHLHTAGAKRFAKPFGGRFTPKAEILLEILRGNPFQTPPSYEKLVGDLAGVYSRRINLQHRLVYEVDKEARTVKAIRMWIHYE